MSARAAVNLNVRGSMNPPAPYSPPGIEVAFSYTRSLKSGDGSNQVEAMSMMEVALAAGATSADINLRDLLDSNGEAFNCNEPKIITVEAVDAPMVIKGGAADPWTGTTVATPFYTATTEIMVPANEAMVLTACSDASLATGAANKTIRAKNVGAVAGTVRITVWGSKP